ncbi:MAG TPA: type II toxin-antitoxin system RelE/ParE family toxin [Saprospiraceae bacterium]|nr:type II toxin-antitoxin system RelE/ParE family toxin [Saprospiraceae bacterium]
MVEINWTHRSVNDLKNIFDYISYDSKRYAERQIKKIQQRAQILKSFPDVGSQVKEVDQNDIKQLVEGPYRIIYKKISDQRIDILTIHHSKQNLDPEKL